MQQGDQIGHPGGFFANPEAWVSLAFVVFVVLFGRKIWEALCGVLDRRADMIRAELEEAARLRREAEAMLDQASRQRDDALLEAANLRESAHGEAARLIEAARQDASNVAARRERMALDRIASAEQAALSEVRRAAASVTARATAEVIRSAMTPEADRRLIDRAIADLPAAFTQKRAA